MIAPINFYRSLFLLFLPALGFTSFLYYLIEAKIIVPEEYPAFLPWQFYIIALCGFIGIIGGVLDWRYHRNPLKLKISKKERDAEAKALGFGGVPMLLLMMAATVSTQPSYFLLPVILVLLYTTVAICYDEFVFHIYRCGQLETLFHRMLVFGNGAAWLAWVHFVFV